MIYVAPRGKCDHGRCKRVYSTFVAASTFISAFEESHKKSRVGDVMEEVNL